MDSVGEFLEDRCVADPAAEVPMGDLYESYVEWCRDQRQPPEKKNEFGQMLTERGYQPAKGAKGIRVRRGLRLKTAEEEPPISIDSLAAKLRRHA